MGFEPRDVRPEKNRVCRGATPEPGRVIAGNLFLHAIRDKQMKKWLIILGIFVGCAAAFVLSYVYVLHAPVSAEQPAKPQVDVPALRAKAESGDPQAQAQLGDLYLKGEGVTNSYAEAAKWFRLSAEKNNAEGQLGLGQLYEAGQGGIPKDITQAEAQSPEAAEQGSAGAQYTLGFMYESGRGVPKNQAEATKWYAKAAEQGDALSQFDLAQRYELGVGAKMDQVEALKWYLVAARQGQPDSAKRADKLKQFLSSSEIAEAQRRADAFSPHPSSPAK